MTIRAILGSIIMMFVIALPAGAGGKDELQKYFNNTAREVKAATDPAEKREILNSSLERMTRALEVAEGSSLLSEEARADAERFRAILQEKIDELNGENGFGAVADVQLNNFSDYVVQDMEQAVETVSISLVALLLIIIIVILVV